MSARADQEEILFGTFHLADDIARGNRLRDHPHRGFFFIRTLFAIGVTTTFSVILSAQGLWRLQTSQSR